MPGVVAPLVPPRPANPRVARGRAAYRGARALVGPQGAEPWPPLATPGACTRASRRTWSGSGSACDQPTTLLSCVHHDWTLHCPAGVTISVALSATLPRWTAGFDLWTFGRESEPGVSSSGRSGNRKGHRSSTYGTWSHVAPAGVGCMAMGSLGQVATPYRCASRGRGGSRGRAEAEPRLQPAGGRWGWVGDGGGPCRRRAGLGRARGRRGWGWGRAQLARRGGRCRYAGRPGCQRAGGLCQRASALPRQSPVLPPQGCEHDGSTARRHRARPARGARRRGDAATRRAA